MPVTVLDTTQLYKSGIPATLTISAGSNRFALIAVMTHHGSGGARVHSTATLGGVNLTPLALLDAPSGCNASMGVFCAYESDIAAMSGSAFTVTGGASSGATYESVAFTTFQNVRQAAPTHNSVWLDSSASGAVSLVRAADSLTVGMAYIAVDNAYSSSANPSVGAGDADVGVVGTFGIGIVADTERTADFTFSNAFARDVAAFAVNLLEPLPTAITSITDPISDNLSLTVSGLTSVTDNPKPVSGGPFLISGSGFGTVAGYADHIANSGFLDSVADGATYSAQVGRWNPLAVEGSVSKPFKRSNAGKNGAICLYERDLGGSPYNITQVFAYDAPVPLGSKVFASYWVKHNCLTAGQTGQHKMLRFTADMGISDKNGETFISVYNTAPSASAAIRNASTVISSGDTDYFDPSGMPAGQNKWVRVDFLHTMPTSYTAKDTYKLEMWVHDPDFSATPRYELITDDQVTRQHSPYDTAADLWNQLIYQNWFGNDGYQSAQHDIWLADLYNSVGTQKRVELCNTNNIATATKREIQPYTSWSDTLIECVRNQGVFTTGETAYLIAIGEAGEQLGFREVVV